VIWSGVLGGAETWSVSMAEQLRALGVNATVVVITSSRPLSDGLRAGHPPVIELGLSRGGALIRAPRRYATVLRDVGAHGALLMTSGYMATMLRIGGYRGPLIGIEHGQLLQTPETKHRRWSRQLDLLIGAHCLDAQVAVSSFMLTKLERLPHHPRVSVIPNGVDLGHYRPERPLGENGSIFTIGWAGRLIAGKGVDDLLRASARLTARNPFRVLIAGDGPERESLQALASGIAPSGAVKFIGTCHDMPAFWNGCDLAVATSNQLEESFGLASLEASACGRPVVATRNGGFVEVVEHGETGQIVPPGDIEALAAGISRYLGDPELAREHGARGRARATDRFDIRMSALSYVKLLDAVRAPSSEVV
jgi:glycosyltransferase involved in cell wall biosynthesis